MQVSREFSEVKKVISFVKKKKPSLLNKLKSKDDLSHYDFLRYVGLIKKHTKSNKSALISAESALKYIKYHPNGSINVAQSIIKDLEHISYHTKSEEVVERSAISIEMCNSYKEASELSNKLSSIAIEYIAIDHKLSERFDRLAKHFCPKTYGIRHCKNEVRAW